jgi:hypothetical protein
MVHIIPIIMINISIIYFLEKKIYYLSTHFFHTKFAGHSVNDSHGRHVLVTLSNNAHKNCQYVYGLSPMPSFKSVAPLVHQLPSSTRELNVSFISCSRHVVLQSTKNYVNKSRIFFDLLLYIISGLCLR